MSFKEQQNTIVAFLTENYNEYLPASLKNPTFTKDFLDFDKYKGDFTVFVDFERIDFRQSNYEDDCRDIEHLSMTVYLVHRNNQSEILNEKNLDAAFSFYELIKDKPALGVAQNTVIESMDFYRYVEGAKYLVCSEIALSLQIET
jgi:hypothetical protein